MIAVSVVLIWTLLGMRKGISSQAAFLISALAVIACAVFGYNPCQKWMIEQYDIPLELSGILSLIAVITVPLALAILVHYIVRQILKSALTPWIDKLGGALAGFICACTFVILSFTLINFLPQDIRPDVTGNKSLIGNKLLGTESNLLSKIEIKIENTRTTIQKARDERTGRRESWDQ
jgi:uncharacterized membrane protein required for colicin V production